MSVDYFCPACSHAWDLHRDVCAACLGREQVCRQRPVRMVSAAALAANAPSTRELTEVGRPFWLAQPAPVWSPKPAAVARPVAQAPGQQVVVRGVFRR